MDKVSGSLNTFKAYPHPTAFGSIWSARELLAGREKFAEHFERLATERVETWTPPVINPDGYEYSRADNWWSRKLPPAPREAVGATQASATDRDQDKREVEVEEIGLNRPTGETPQARPAAGYHSFEALTADHDKLVQDNPNCVKKKFLGKSPEGRDLWWIPLSNKFSEGSPLPQSSVPASPSSLVDWHSVGQLVFEPWEQKSRLSQMESSRSFIDWNSYSQSVLDPWKHKGPYFEQESFRTEVGQIRCTLDDELAFFDRRPIL